MISIYIYITQKVTKIDNKLDYRNEWQVLRVLVQRNRYINYQNLLGMNSHLLQLQTPLNDIFKH